MEGLDDPEMWVMQMQYMDAHFGSLLDERDDLVKERDELVAAIRRLSNLDGKCAYDRSEISQIIEEILAKYPEAS
jgi:hypothetical protein